MKITKTKLKTIIKEEVEAMQTEGLFGDAGKGMKAVGGALAKKLSGIKALRPLFGKLAARDNHEKAQFVAQLCIDMNYNPVINAAAIKSAHAKLSGVESEAGRERVGLGFGGEGDPDNLGGTAAADDPQG